MKYFIKNNQLLPIAEATVSLYSIEMTYGFGVYESIRVKDNSALFVNQHIDRLMNSAEIIDLEHRLTPSLIHESIQTLITKTDETTYNLKIILLGGRTAETASIYILPMRPKFPDRKLFKTGVHLTTTNYERHLPKAKSLNMLPSYLAYREAQKSGAYDSLLINSEGFITEGTRTNFFAMKGNKILTPPSIEVLEGVTRQNVITTALMNNFMVTEKPLKLSGVNAFDSCFITSTSSKIMPIKSIDDTSFSISEDLKRLQRNFNEFITSSTT